MDSSSGKGAKKQSKKLDFYELLELDKTATPEQIKSSYKKLALVHSYLFNCINLEMASWQKRELWGVKREVQTHIWGLHR